MDRRLFLAAAASLTVAACGGGVSSPSSTGVITPAPAIRKDLGYGYFFGQSTYVEEVADHTNLWWAAYNQNPVDQMAGLLLAGARFRDIVLDVPAWPLTGDPETEIRFYFDRLARAPGGLLRGVTCLYPCDEPDGLGLGDSDVGRRNDLIRKIAPDYGVKDVPLGVFYSVGSGQRPGVTSYDRLGLSAYEAKNGQRGMLDALMERARPDAKSWVIEYGAKPWSLDPATMTAYAHATPRVAAVIAFGWQTLGTVNPNVGIREQNTAPAGMKSLRDLYVEQGLALRT